MERAHATALLSQRRQVPVARVTRRSQSGQVADSRRLALDQAVNVEAGIEPRQYRQGMAAVSCSLLSRAVVAVMEGGASRRPEVLLITPPKHREHEAARTHEGRMNPAA